MSERVRNPLTKRRKSATYPDSRTFPIFEKLGGKHAVMHIISLGRHKPMSASTLRMWKWKRRIPANACQLLLAECQRRGIEFSVPDDFVIKPRIVTGNGEDADQEGVLDRPKGE